MFHDGRDIADWAPAGKKNLRLLTTVGLPDPKTALKELASACAIRRPALILDGLFGIGLSRALDEDWQKLIATVNELNALVLSVDVPSGLDADTGEMRGATINAAITLTLGAPKRGLLAAAAIPVVGRLEVATEIGLTSCPFTGKYHWTCAGDFEDFPPRRPCASHKGTYGHVTIFAGSLGYHGAAVLAARGALRAQPGLVTVFTPENVYLPVASPLQAAMVHPWKSAIDVPDSCSAILFGPGLAARDLPDHCKRNLNDFWTGSPLPVVVDASALDWLPAGGNFKESIRVITPHPGEAARMLSISTGTVQADRVSALRNLSARYGNCFVVLKGHQTLVGKSEGEIFVNSSGNPHLAQGGSGDVLAGYIAGLIAQKGLQAEVLRTIRYAVWQHGNAADRLCDHEANWNIEDLLNILGRRKE